MNTRRATIAFILAHIESRPRITFMHATAETIHLSPCQIQGENQISQFETWKNHRCLPEEYNRVNCLPLIESVMGST